MSSKIIFQLDVSENLNKRLWYVVIRISIDCDLNRSKLHINMANKKALNHRIKPRLRFSKTSKYIKIFYNFLKIAINNTLQ